MVEDSEDSAKTTTNENRKKYVKEEED